MGRLLSMWILLLAGCSGSTGEPPTTGAGVCKRPGQQCRVRPGVLGVCQRGDSARFVCTPQH